MPDLFDYRMRAMRRDRAARLGPELFLYERVFEDCLERVTLMERRFERALLIGCPDPGWRDRLGSLAAAVDVRDPGALFAGAAGGSVIVEDAWEPIEVGYDLIIAIGTLDTVNDLPLALRLLRYAIAAGGLLIGAMSGGETLPRLREAMRAADAVVGMAAPHVHPRIQASALSPLLAGAGFHNPVVDVDRVQVSYGRLDKLVTDLRRMGTTNVLSEAGRPLSASQWAAASAAFANAASGGRTAELFELLHFAAWAPNG